MFELDPSYLHYPYGNLDPVTYLTPVTYLIPVMKGIWWCPFSTEETTDPRPNNPAILFNLWPWAWHVTTLQLVFFHFYFNLHCIEFGGFHVLKKKQIRPYCGANGWESLSMKGHDIGHVLPPVWCSVSDCSCFTAVCICVRCAKAKDSNYLLLKWTVAADCIVHHRASRRQTTLRWSGVLLWAGVYDKLL